MLQEYVRFYRGRAHSWLRQDKFCRILYREFRSVCGISATAILPDPVAPEIRIFFWLSRPHRESLLCPTSEQLPQLFVIAPRTVADSLCLQTAPHPLADAAAALAVQRSECARRWAASLIKSAVRRERLAAKADVVLASRSDGQTLCLGRRSFPNPAVCRSKLPRPVDHNLNHIRPVENGLHSAKLFLHRTPGLADHRRNQSLPPAFATSTLAS